MTARLGVWLLLAAAGWGYAFWVYGRRELPVAARRYLALLRGAAMALVAFLILDFGVPGGPGDTGAWTLVDLSSSMTVPQGPAGEAPADRAMELAGASPAEGRATFGSPGGVLAPDWSPEGDSPLPPATDSRLAPALARALESGATEVTVLTDLRVDDPVEVEGLLASAGVPVTFVDLGGPVINVGVAELQIPATARSSEELTGELTLFGAAQGPVDVTVSIDGRVAWDTVVTSLPAEEGAGGRVRVPLRFTAPAESGPVAVAARASVPGDVHPADDVRTRGLEVDPGAGELVLVSWSPDWEPRFLLPVLAEVTGLRSQGYLRVGADRFMTMTGPVRVVSADEAAAALEEARLGVAHGFGGEIPDRWRRALDRAPLLISLPGGAARAGSGEWFLSASVPPSPVAGELAGIPLLGLPPLGGGGSAPPGGSPVLLVQRGGAGEEVPALLLREGARGRRAEGLADGFWRWGFRDGAGRDLYRRLWAGVSGWLLAGEGSSVREVGLGPVTGVAAPGAPQEWRAGPAAGGAVEVRFEPAVGGEAGEVATLPVDSLGRVSVPAPDAPGTYRWRARVSAGPGEGAESEGLLVVESADLDLLSPRAVHLTGMDGGLAAGDAPRRRRPVRTHPLPFLLLLGLLATEWTLRRRSGLR